MGITTEQIAHLVDVLADEEINMEGSEDEIIITQDTIAQFTEAQGEPEEQEFDDLTVFIWRGRNTHASTLWLVDYGNVRAGFMN